MKPIYVVRQEYNDKGWCMGDNFFLTPEDAAHHLRDAVAHRIKWMRKDGYKISCFHQYNKIGINYGITFRSCHKDYGYEYYDFRVHQITLWDNVDEVRELSVQKHYI